MFGRFAAGCRQGRPGSTGCEPFVPACRQGFRHPPRRLPAWLSTARYDARIPTRCQARNRAREADRARRVFRYGAIAPAPIWTLAPILASAIPGRLAEPVLEESEETLLRDLEAGSIEAAVLLRTPPGPAWRGRAFLRERLGVMLPPVHPLARRKTLRFADLAGETFVVFGAIGFWMPLCRARIPRATFLEQGTLDATRRIVANSDLPAFHTAVAASRAPAPEGRVVIPLRDPEATATYHFVCRADRADALAPVFDALPAP